MLYPNTDTDKLSILTDNKGKARIYLWTHLDSGKIYVGSAMDLSKRLIFYYSIGYITRNSKSYIHNVLLCHGYSSFSLTILNYIDVSNLSLDEAKTLIL
jgi:group I intron endonuclease